MSVSKIVAAAASGAGGASLDIPDVFSTFVADATGSGSLTINNGIDLSGEGGIVWVKSRNGTANHFILDPDLGSGAYLQPNTDAVVATGANYSFTSTGLTDAYNNYSNNEAVWWTFRKATKFFDKVTYTGNGTAGRTVAHNLGSVPGMIIVKCTSNASTLWVVYHRGMDGSAPEEYFLRLNDNNSIVDFTYWNDTAPTSTEFTLNGHDDVNQTGRTYVAYLFAHNNNDGGFGESGDQDIIKCGSYSVDSSAKASINLGFEPQWILYRPYDDTADFKIIDNMRGFMGITPVSDSYNKAVSTNRNIAEYDEDGIHITSTGFEHVSGFANKNMIYMAIRRGPLAAPTDATKVFAMDTMANQTPAFDSGFPVDMAIRRNLDYATSNAIWSRLTGAKTMNTDSAAAESNDSESFDHMDGWGDGSTYSSNQAWMWKRAPSYFDVVTYTGTGSNRTIAHNLGAVPEMMWVKKRNLASGGLVYHSALAATENLQLFGNGADAAYTYSGNWNSTRPTDTVISIGTNGNVNSINDKFIAYLFATVAGVSKVGSYDGNGSNQNIDCGFSSGARFILIKSKQSGSWYVFDTVRGIVAGNDSHLKLDSDAAEAYADSIDTYSGGFNVVQNSTTDLNKGPSDESYIFYAIA